MTGGDTLGTPNSLHTAVSAVCVLRNLSGSIGSHGISMVTPLGRFHALASR